jgi:DNA-binding transcriptional ArsR family regulator
VRALIQIETSETSYLTNKNYLVNLPVKQVDNNIKSDNMNKKTRARYELRARIIKAMAHPTRLFIVDELSRGERCVCELTRMIKADLSTVSKHLSILKSVGIVRDEKRGLQVWYRLRVPCILNFFGCVEKVIESQAKEHLTLL